MKTIKRNNKSLYRRLIVWALLTTFIGLFLFVAPTDFNRLNTYQYLRETFPSLAWATLMTVSGGSLLFCIFKGILYKKIRKIIALIAVLYLMIAVGVAIACIVGGAPSGLVVAIFVFLAVYGFELITEQPYGSSVDSLLAHPETTTEEFKG